MKRIFITAIVAVPLMLIMSILFLRFLGRNEDTWICKNGQWVKRGNPTEPIPSAICGINSQTCEKTCRGMGGMGKEMAREKAIEIAKRECANTGKLTGTCFCNSGTNTWWFDLKPKNKKSGCDPACVVNVETEKTEINWRCTGLKQ